MKINYSKDGFKDMNDEKFIKISKDIIRVWLNKTFDNFNYISDDNIYVVWQCYTLGNFKGLFSTTHLDGLYYEITYDKNNNKFYIDVYRQNDHIEVSEEDNIKENEKEVNNNSNSNSKEENKEKTNSNSNSNNKEENTNNSSDDDIKKRLNNIKTAHDLYCNITDPHILAKIIFDPEASNAIIELGKKFGIY